MIAYACTAQFTDIDTVVDGKQFARRERILDGYKKRKWEDSGHNTRCTPREYGIEILGA